MHLIRCLGVGKDDTSPFLLDGDHDVLKCLAFPRKISTDALNSHTVLPALAAIIVV